MGGLLIGISSTLNLYLYGRITGLSGAFNSLIKYDKNAGFLWKIAFILGLIDGPFWILYLKGNSIDFFGNNLTVFDTP